MQIREPIAEAPDRDEAAYRPASLPFAHIHQPRQSQLLRRGLARTASPGFCRGPLQCEFPRCRDLKNTSFIPSHQRSRIRLSAPFIRSRGSILSCPCKSVRAESDQGRHSGLRTHLASLKDDFKRIPTNAARSQPECILLTIPGTYSNDLSRRH